MPEGPGERDDDGCKLRACAEGTDDVREMGADLGHRDLERVGDLGGDQPGGGQGQDRVLLRRQDARF
jgi:hypothetical protein